MMLTCKRQRCNLSILAMLFFGAFIYAIVAMVVSRELVIPRMVPSINGHIAGDPYYYHTLALKKAEDIRARGFGEFEFQPEGQGPAGVASLAYLVWENPYSVVFLNAVLHGVSVVMMAMILKQWFSQRTSLIATLPIAISPYMITWFSQINKDSFTLAGVLLFTYGLLKLVGVKGRSLLHRDVLLSLLIIATGLLLNWLVRPYVNQMLLPITSLIFVIVFSLRAMSAFDSRELLRFAVSGMVVLACLANLGKGAASDATLDSFEHYRFLLSQTKGTSKGTVSAECLARIDERQWHNVSLLPGFVNEKLKVLMGRRCLIFTILHTQTNATTLYSVVDTDILPNGTAEALAYLPRAALLGIASPWPDRWGYIFNHRASAFYIIVPFEAAMLYVGLISLFIWFVRRKAWSALIPISFSVTVMTIYGMATPYLGALYRYRYPWWIILLCLGMAALLEILNYGKVLKVSQFQSVMTQRKWHRSGH